MSEFASHPPLGHFLKSKAMLGGQTAFRAFCFLLILIATLAPPGANAAAVHDCDRLDSIGNLIGNVRSFAQGAIRVAYITTEEPAAAPEHILIFVEEGPGGARCYAVSATADGRGFAAVDFKGLAATYDSDKGLLISLSVATDPRRGASGSAGRVKVRIDRRSGNNAVSIER
jgi:hypothetical protein